MRRGDVVTIAAGGGFGGKPRPALIIQADEFDRLTTVVVALLTSKYHEAVGFRPRFQPSETNGLRSPSDLMVDVLVTTRRDKVGAVIGRFDEEEMRTAETALFVFLGFAV